MNKEELLRYAKSEANRLLENVGEALMPSPEAIDDGAHGFVNYYPLKILAPVAGSKGLEIAAQYNDGRTMGLYIHTPLCYSKCTFCSYVSLPYSQEIADRYFAALEKEIIIAGNLYKRNTVSSVYFGGGTSTIWPVERLEKLFTLIDENFYLLRRGSICFEANPKVFAESKKANDRKFERLAELGVDRISIGIQSFNHGLLKKVGRGYYHKEDILSSLDL
ncbi:MAG: radical SAM protein, partial [Nanoarchaeota archaeon]|nr:radical SAM protein [Nanoarchaeota archaeon]